MIAPLDALLWNYLFWGLLALYVIWFFLPPWCWFFCGAIQQAWVEPGMDAEQDSPISPHVLNKLFALGFEPLGTLRVHFWLEFEGWNRRHYERVYRAPNSECYACVFAKSSQEPPYFRFITFFVGEGALVTTNEFEGDHRLAHLVGQGVLTTDITQLVAAHRRVLAELTAVGRQLERHDQAAWVLRFYDRGPRLPWHFRLRMALSESREPFIWLAIPCLFGWLANHATWSLAMGLVLFALIAVVRRNEQRKSMVRFRAQALENAMKLTTAESGHDDRSDTGTSVTN